MVRLLAFLGSLNTNPPPSRILCTYGEDRLYSHRQPRDLRGAEDSLRAEDAGR